MWIFRSGLGIIGAMKRTTLILSLVSFVLFFTSPAFTSENDTAENDTAPSVERREIGQLVLENIPDIPPEISEDKEIGFREFSKRNSMIVVSDGDIIRNQFRIPGGEPLALGYDQFTRETFGNKEFILNSINYLVDGSSLISIRSREVKLRLLDKTKMHSQRLTYQVMNTLGPVVLIILLGAVLIWVRKRKYSR